MNVVFAYGVCGYSVYASVWCIYIVCMQVYASVDSVYPVYGGDNCMVWICVCSVCRCMYVVCVCAVCMCVQIVSRIANPLSKSLNS